VTLWSGRVGTGLAPEVSEFLQAEDAELLPYDVEATRLHAARLRAAGLLSAEELAEALRLLGEIVAQGLSPQGAVPIAWRTPKGTAPPCGRTVPRYRKSGATLSVRADVAELVDAHGSGPCGGNPVEVQVLSSA